MDPNFFKVNRSRFKLIESLINKYPIKFQNDSRKNIHLNNSYALNIEILQQRFSSY
jgi:hypothetical protein